MEIPTLCLGGNWFRGTVAFMSSLRQTCFSVTVVSLALETQLYLGFELKVSMLWILFNLPANHLHLMVLMVVLVW